jgi:hypothetical protein
MSRRLDHVVLAARDLDAQAQIFRHMGFRVGARNAHPWGTQNHIVQFADTFLELICAPAPYHAPVDPDPRAFSFAAFVHDYVQTREGAAMLALTGADARADAQAFHDWGMGDFEPFHFERRGQRANGEPTQVGFTLAFARAKTMPDVGFFTCAHQYPENFWDRDLQSHANGVTGVSKVTLVAENPADHAEFLSHFTQLRDFRSSSMGIEFELGDGQVIEVLTPVAYGFHYGAQALSHARVQPHIAALELRTSSLESVRQALTGGRIDYTQDRGRLIVQASAACGVTLAFAAV